MTLIDCAVNNSAPAVETARTIGGKARLRLLVQGQPDQQDIQARRLRLLGEAVEILAATVPEDFDAEGSLAVAREIERVARAAEAALVRCVRAWQDRGDPVQTPDTTEEELAWRFLPKNRARNAFQPSQKRGKVRNMGFLAGLNAVLSHVIENQSLS